ncbi:hypothetical protein [Deinococcus knuensis]|uniref:hypothetical protein n=1 Tax=Deinococcus knuensis TaxID=1837380 RepID=UPI001E3BC80C|nr:hypothetical protein [Deinococcus knuensis]
MLAFSAQRLPVKAHVRLVVHVLSPVAGEDVPQRQDADSSGGIIVTAVLDVHVGEFEEERLAVSVTDRRIEEPFQVQAVHLRVERPQIVGQLVPSFSFQGLNVRRAQRLTQGEPLDHEQWSAAQVVGQSREQGAVVRECGADGCDQIVAHQTSSPRKCRCPCNPTFWT